MTAEQMWHAYCESSGVSEQTPYSAWAFCGGGAVGDELAQLVLAGTKTATASALLAFELEQEPLPNVGEYSVILFSSGEAAGVICDTKVTLVPFDEVSASMPTGRARATGRWRIGRRFTAKRLRPILRQPGSPSTSTGCASWKSLRCATRR